MTAQFGAVVSLPIQNSSISSPSWVGINLDTPSAAQFLVMIANSRIDSGLLAFSASPNNGGTVITTFSNDAFNTTVAGKTVQFNVDSSVKFASSACLLATGNTLTHSAGFFDFFFSNLNGGVMNVVDPPNLSANNAGAALHPGPATNVAACP